MQEPHIFVSATLSSVFSLSYPVDAPLSFMILLELYKLFSQAKLMSLITYSIYRNGSRKKPYLVP
jgi:hypothetical protein